MPGLVHRKTEDSRTRSAEDHINCFTRILSDWRTIGLGTEQLEYPNGHSLFIIKQLRNRKLDRETFHRTVWNKGRTILESPSGGSRKTEELNRIWTMGISMVEMTHLDENVNAKHHKFKTWTSSKSHGSKMSRNEQLYMTRISTDRLSHRTQWSRGNSNPSW